MRGFIWAAALGLVLLISSARMRGADNGFPIYFPDSKLIVKAETINQTTYLPLLDIVRFLKLPYTDAIALETFTIRSGASRLVLTKNSGLISINDQVAILPNPIVREGDRWMAPVEFLTLGLSRITGVEYRYRSGAPRLFAGNVEAPELAMNAQTLGSITRLTISIGSPAHVSVNRDDPHRAVVAIDRSPLDPARQTLDFSDRLVRGIAYDDSDGNSKIFVDTTDEVSDVRATPAEGNEIFFIDFVRKGAPAAEAATPTPPQPAAPAAPRAGNALQSQDRRVRVVVIDPGHGGMDSGARNNKTSEKDLTLALARKLRLTLQTRLGITVVLTRDSDAAMDNEARAAVANNNQANLFISLHVGYANNPLDTGSSIFIMKEGFGGEMTSAANPLFLPWYLGYRRPLPLSSEIAALVQDELTKAVPGWKFPVRNAPLAVLCSASMPSLALEIGNLNSPANSQTLLDPAFQTRIVTAVADAVQRFSGTAGTGD